MKIMRIHVTWKLLGVLAMVALSGCYSEGRWRMPWQSSPFQAPDGAKPSTVGAPKKPSEIASRNSGPTANRYADNAPAWTPGATANANPAGANINYPRTPYPENPAVAAQPGYNQNPGAAPAGAYGTPPPNTADARNAYGYGGAPATGGSVYDRAAPAGAPPTDNYGVAGPPAGNSPPVTGYGPTNNYAPANTFPPNPVHAASGVDPNRYNPGTPDAAANPGAYAPQNTVPAATPGYSPAPSVPANATPEASPYAPPNYPTNNAPNNGAGDSPAYRPGSVSDYRPTTPNLAAPPASSGVVPASYTPTVPAAENNPPAGGSYYTPATGNTATPPPPAGTSY
jgi:hypothetical protein